MFYQVPFQVFTYMNVLNPQGNPKKIGSVIVIPILEMRKRMQGEVR